MFALNARPEAARRNSRRSSVFTELLFTAVLCVIIVEHSRLLELSRAPVAPAVSRGPSAAAAHTWRARSHRATRLRTTELIGATVGADSAGANILMVVFGGQDVYVNFGAGTVWGQILYFNILEMLKYKI